MCFFFSLLVRFRTWIVSVFDERICNVFSYALRFFFSWFSVGNIEGVNSQLPSMLISLSSRYVAASFFVCAFIQNQCIMKRTKGINVCSTIELLHTSFSLYKFLFFVEHFSVVVVVLFARSLCVFWFFGFVLFIFYLPICQIIFIIFIIITLHTSAPPRRYCLNGVDFCFCFAAVHTDNLRYNCVVRSYI